MFWIDVCKNSNVIIYVVECLGIDSELFWELAKLCENQGAEKKGGVGSVWSNLPQTFFSNSPSTKMSSVDFSNFSFILEKYS